MTGQLRQTRVQSVKVDAQRRPGRPAFDESDKPAAERFDRACQTITLSTGKTSALWRQLAEQLETVIRSGELQPGSRMPSEAVLSSRFGVSRPVVRHALQTLAARGLVVKLPRKGIFVGEPQPQTAFITTNLAAYDDLIARGHKVTTTNFELYRSEPNAQERDKLKLEDSDTVVRVGRVFYMDGKPICHARISFNGAKVPGLEDADLENRPILRYIQTRYERRLARAERWMKAVMPLQEVAVLMNVQQQTPMIWVESVAYEAENSHSSTIVPTTIPRSR